jgi:hypothetical protein
MITLGTLGAIVFLFFPAPTVDPTPSPEDWGLGADAVHDPDLAPLRLTDIPPGIPFETRRAPFTLVTRGDPTPYAIFFMAALPGEVLDLELDPGEERPILTYNAGAVVSSHEGGWGWKAPLEPGGYALRLDQVDSGESLFLNVFVLHTRDSVESGSLKGYKIGTYESRPLRGDSVYLPPPGFIEVSSSDENILVGPHFTVGQFLCKQPGEPRFLALSRYLVAKLEMILERSNAVGYPAGTLHVMSGFRTPWYNRLIGNRTVYSRHLWGGAADIFLDVDGDGNMDDLNRDGRSSIEDAQLLLEIVDWVDRSGNPGTRPGGLGAYKRNSVRGPFVHVDARGRLARW